MQSELSNLQNYYCNPLERSLNDIVLRRGFISDEAGRKIVNTVIRFPYETVVKHTEYTLYEVLEQLNAEAGLYERIDRSESDGDNVEINGVRYTVAFNPANFPSIDLSHIDGTELPNPVDGEEDDAIAHQLIRVLHAIIASEYKNDFLDVVLTHYREDSITLISLTPPQTEVKNG